MVLPTDVTLPSGRILERNRDKSLQSFPLCYSQSPLLKDSRFPIEKKWFETTGL
jgi:hypothetical protein